METKEDEEPDETAVAAVVNDSSIPAINRNVLKAHHRQESMLFNLQADRPDYFQNLRRGSTTNLRLEERPPSVGNDAVEDASSSGEGPSSRLPALLLALSPLPKSKKSLSPLPKSGTTNEAAASAASPPPTNTTTAVPPPPVTNGNDSPAVEEISNEILPRISLTSSFASMQQQQQQQQQRVEVRLKNYSYHVPIRIDGPSIKTTFNQTPCYLVTVFIRHVIQLISGQRKFKDLLGHYENKYILKDINLVLRPGTTYLVMGAPGSGKTTLLEAIAGRLPMNNVINYNNANVTNYDGRIEYNGASMDEDDTGIVLQNIVSYVGQLDIHAPFLTVQETFDFAANCRIGMNKQQQQKKKKKKKSSNNNDEEDEHTFSENLTIDGLDLGQCRSTYVWDANNRGVSGGQRRRVTLGEMMVGQAPVACADEVSTGLDAAVTYDISSSIVKFAKAAGTTRLVSLLQPGPETFSLYDEVILLAEGYVIYSGPVDNVIDYFARLGYRQLNTMDVADFLQSVATPDGLMMFNADESPSNKHYSATEFANAFRSSVEYKEILAQLSSPLTCNWNVKAISTTQDEENQADSSKNIPKEFKQQYRNSFLTSVKLNLYRNLTLLKRDREFLIGKVIENCGMGFGMALIFLQSAAFPSRINESDKVAQYFTDGCPVSDLGVYADSFQKALAGTYSSIFLTCFHILLGTLTGSPDEVDGRPIYYKHADARFYEAGSFLIGRTLSILPLLALEIFAFGLPFYFISGLAYEAKAFFVFLAILVTYKFALRMLFGVLAHTLPKKANVQGIGTFIYLLLTMTSGFIMYPSVMPPHWKLIFWINPMAWAQQGMIYNQFTSSKVSLYSCEVNGKVITLTESAIEIRGWRMENVGVVFAFLLPFTLVFSVITWLAMKYIRLQPDRQHVKKSVNIGSIVKAIELSIPFTPADLSFENLVYEVNASTADDKLRLLNEVSGVFRAGRMCALMGSSGAGKTTLMDVIAMRKTSGSITGKIELNGFDQERISFLRSSGYVEQFDVQQPELTVRETVAFSARLRLDVNNPAIGSDAMKMNFVDYVLATMELTNIQTLQVGSFEEGGLSFEQRKRLAIACELAGSPSVLFLDEPTSGLDSRGALVVIRAMRRIADSGRTVVATIHQPSAAVFELFDDLILLKRGGNIVFSGELGEESINLVKYFEERGAKPIEQKENPAAWVLRAYAGEHTSNDADWAELYKSSEQFRIVRSQIETIRSTDNRQKLSFSSTFSTPGRERVHLMVMRMQKIYRRSAPYNMTRIMVSMIYAFLLGSIFLHPKYWTSLEIQWSEHQASGLIGTIFLSLNVIGTAAMTMAIPVAKRVRDVFYKHRASGMIEHNAMFVAMLVAELPYLLLMAVLYVVVYCATAGLFTTFTNFFWFVFFFFMHTASFSYFAQCFMCLVRDEKTVGALQGAWIGLNLFYAGFVVLPQNFFSFFKSGLWMNATRYAFEGIVFSQFEGISSSVVADKENHSPFYTSLRQNGQCSVDTVECSGTAIEYASFYFGEKFSASNRGLDVGMLLAWIFLANFGTWICLKKLQFVNT